MTHDEMIAIIQAAKDGKAIECVRVYLGKPTGPWTKIKITPVVFNFQNYRYRVSPEVREFVLVVAEDGKVLGGAAGPPRDGHILSYKPSAGEKLGVITTLHRR